MIFYVVLLTCYGHTEEIFRTPEIEVAYIYAEQMQDDQCSISVKKKVDLKNKY